MKYQEAVKRAVDVWYSVYNEEDDNDPANGEAAHLDAEALAVLRRAEGVMGEIEQAEMVNKVGGWRGFKHLGLIHYAAAEYREPKEPQ